MKLTKVKNKRFGNKKTRRIKKRGGMYNQLTPRERAEAHEKMRKNDPTRNAALTAAQTAFAQRLSRGVSHGVRNAFLTSGTGALAGRVVGLSLAKKYIPLKQAIKLDNFTLHSAMIASDPASVLIKEDIFQQAEELCSTVRALPHDECWTTNDWGQLRKTELVKNTCSEARGLYTRAVEMNYLPAYAPLAWMISREDPEGSMDLCEECIAECDKRRGAPFSRKAKLDCTAIRAFADQESLAIMMSKFRMEQQHAPRWTHLADDNDLEDEAETDAELEAFKKIMKESIKKNRKYGHAMKWLWLSTLSNEDPNPDEIAAQKKIAEDAGIDFDRCR